MSAQDAVAFARREVEALTAAQAVPTNGSSAYRGVIAAGSTYDQIVPIQIDWIWPGILARGFVAELSGDPGGGKSLLTIEAAACISTGRPLPGGRTTEPAGVVMLSFEDHPAAVVRPRLDAAGADLSSIFCLRGVRVGEDEERDVILPTDLDALRDAASRVEAAVVIIDPILTALDRQFDSHKDQDTKRAFRPLTALAHEMNVAVWFVRHLNKSGGRAVTRPGGSIGLTGTSRLSSLVAADPDDAERRLLLPVKSNLGAPHPSWVFRIATDAPGAAPHIVWDTTPRALTADDVLGAEVAGAEERAQLGEVVDWLYDLMETGPKPVKELKAEARAAGFGWRTVEKAKSRLGLRSSKTGFGHAGVWTWGQRDHELPA